MKKTVRILSIIIALVLAFSVCASAVFAASASDEDITYLTEEQVAALMEAQAQADYTLADYDLSVCSIPDFGFSMKLPNFPNAISAASSDEDIYSVINVGKDSLIGSGYLVYCLSDDSSYIIQATYEVTDYSKLVGSYANLSEDEKATAISVNAGSYQLAEDAVKFVKINGVDFLHMEMTENTEDEETGEAHVIESTMLTTIYNGVQYSVLLRFTDLTEADRAAVDEIYNSIKVSKGKLGFAFAGSSVSTLDIILIVLCAILAIAVAFLFSVLRRNGLLGSAPVAQDVEDDDDDEDDEEDDEDDEDDEDEE